jgi:hypothetical protein
MVATSQTGSCLELHRAMPFIVLAGALQQQGYEMAFFNTLNRRHALASACLRLVSFVEVE